MKKLTEQIKQALGALASADAGEMLSRREKNQRLAGAAEHVSEPADPGTRSMVVLALGELLPPAVMRYALSVCQRLDADLCVLTDNLDRAWRLLDPHRIDWQTAGIACTTETTGAHRGIPAFFDAHPQTLFAIAGGYGDALSGHVGNRRKLLRKRLPVPVVMVNEDDPRSHAAPTAASLPSHRANIQVC
jgi:hypothetical protein